MNDNLETVQLLPLTSDIVFKQVFGQEEACLVLYMPALYKTIAYRR